MFSGIHGELRRSKAPLHPWPRLKLKTPMDSSSTLSTRAALKSSLHAGAPNKAGSHEQSELGHEVVSPSYPQTLGRSKPLPLLTKCNASVFAAEYKKTSPRRAGLMRTVQRQSVPTVFRICVQVGIYVSNMWPNMLCHLPASGPLRRMKKPVLYALPQTMVWAKTHDNELWSSTSGKVRSIASLDQKSSAASVLA